MANIVITGSSKGIGYGLARECAARNHAVMITGSTERSMQTALQSLRASGLPGSA